MIILDTKLQELEKHGKPIRVGLVGTGFAGRGFALQLLSGIPGMRLAAVSNRTASYAKEAFTDAGIEDVVEAKSADELDQAIREQKHIYTTDAKPLCESKLIDVVVEATGEVEFGAQVVMAAIKNGKHVVLINAELDTTLGPILKYHADQAGVVYTQADGDQPAKLMNLYREVKLLGFKPVLCGNIKSLIDPYRTPETQKAFADAHWQRPKMITSFADGTKISFEMATVANATGFRVGKRGMYGPACKRVEEAPTLFSLEELLQHGLVDYILGAEPSFGVFVLGYSDQPIKQRYMKVYKMGDGPLYTFYTPYHLSPLEAPRSVARAVLYKDPALTPLSGPVCDVITIAKKDLKKGEKLDGIGGFTCYGTIENSDVVAKEKILPMGLSECCVVKKDITKDSPISYDDVTLPSNRIADKLREEQNEKFKK
ncbi:MAG: NAD(P)-dependent oxidoreductase [Candidatus Chisholmbacteria bacterium RIFCSPLOWO2_01_FULL_49_14]|uniref:NAD(P)-dependent oxidoreductase n=1 Tax=Candidatus Chisholmbacteria bacterium RIFCSPLOWO2_01_FULL_49_14 TaxID=1797593 RepID=A0A1G1W4D2_9BACT|nr:MAG: NAD(P)-dependent oxidoreductase [Candidatus Chisholmbacteria bacterium RIFCSPLOWO2_01_FULL_49_14]